MINKEMLEDLYKVRLSESRYGSTPKRMFVDGEFNKYNWNGGDDLIRYFFEDLAYEQVKNVYLVEEDDCCTHVICHVDNVEDQNYATVIVDGNVYYFSWYKNRGCTEVATFNGNKLTEDKYIELLNIIEKTGYDYFN